MHAVCGTATVALPPGPQASTAAAQLKKCGHFFVGGQSETGRKNRRPRARAAAFLRRPAKRGGPGPWPRLNQIMPAAQEVTMTRAARQLPGLQCLVPRQIRSVAPGPASTARSEPVVGLCPSLHDTRCPRRSRLQAPAEESQRSRTPNRDQAWGSSAGGPEYKEVAPRAPEHAGLVSHQRAPRAASTLAPEAATKVCFSQARFNWHAGIRGRRSKLRRARATAVSLTASACATTSSTPVSWPHWCASSCESEPICLGFQL